MCQFSYGSFVWMFHSRRLNHHINLVLWMVLCIVYVNKTFPFDELLAPKPFVPKIMADIFEYFSSCRMSLGVTHLWRPHEIPNFVTPHLVHLRKWKIDLLFKNNRICKHMTNFKIFPTMCVDFINVWSLTV